MPWNEYVKASLNFWVGDAVAIAWLTPFCLVFVMPGLRRFVALQQTMADLESDLQGKSVHEAQGSGRTLGSICFLTIMVGALWLVLGPHSADNHDTFYVFFLPIIWIAVRRGLQLARLIAASPGATQIIEMLHLPLDSERARECKRLGLFTILKPLRRLPLRQVLQSQKAMTVSSNSAPSSGGTEKIPGPVELSILLAEDNVVNQRLISRIPEKMGHSVVVANDGAAALVMLSQRDFDLVAMDMQMPIMDGLEATRKIRRDELGSARHIPIVAIIANAFDDDRRKCFEAGMDGYVVKPVSAKAIGDEVSRVMALFNQEQPESVQK